MIRVGGYDVYEDDIIVQCCVCNKILRVERGAYTSSAPDDSLLHISHGLCAVCLQEYTDELDEQDRVAKLSPKG